MQRESRLTKIAWQYTELLPQEAMDFLRGIAEDYAKVKGSVYERYSGIASLGQLASLYDIMTQMRHCGLREQLGLPSVYYELAVRDAVTDIKGMWGMLKNKIRTLISANENLSDDDRLYLRTVLRLDSVYAAILNRTEYPMPEKAAGLEIDTERLNNLLRRLTRRHLVKPVPSGKADSFCVSPGGYSYRDGALCLVSRVPRKRIRLPLKDGRTCDRQLRICIRENDVAIALPVNMKMRRHEDFQSTIFVHLGYRDMCTLSSGTVYGEGLGELASARSERLMEKNRERGRMRNSYRKSMAEGDGKKAADIEANNLGGIKYDRRKKKEQAQIESYINAGINRMLETEKPGTIVTTRPVTINKKKSGYKQANRRISESPQGYVRRRLLLKCQINGITLVEISSKGTGNICSACGAEGKRLKAGFVCESCGFQSSTALNGARRIEQLYRESQAEKKEQG
ncbi:MAG: transposase [Lachnospiraceae bacterium]|nr:transposase [Lachnospiraceae bacterium]